MTRKEMLDIRMQALMEKAIYMRDFSKAVVEDGAKFLAEFEEMRRKEKEEEEKTKQKITK
jgi:predicted NUDIX family phosphoesterase